MEELILEIENALNRYFTMARVLNHKKETNRLSYDEERILEVIDSLNSIAQNFLDNVPVITTTAKFFVSDVNIYWAVFLRTNG